jgi:hypothetical protein
VTRYALGYECPWKPRHVAGSCDRGKGEGEAKVGPGNLGKTRDYSLVEAMDLELTSEVKDMAELTRKGLLKKTSVGALMVGALGAAPATAAIAATQPQGAPGADLDAQLAQLKHADPFLVYANNPSTGELVLMVGDQEVAVRDHALAARLWQAYRRASQKTVKHGVR